MGNIQKWYRGQSTNHKPSPARSVIHDFGDGIYLTDSRSIANIYANTRASESGGKPKILSLNLDLSKSRILNLNRDPRWKKYLNEPIVPNKPESTPKNMIKAANENYGRMFNSFLKKNNINIQLYDAVIGPEFVRGGNQMVILIHKGNLSDLSIKVINELYRPVPRPPKIVRPLPLGKSGKSIQTRAYRRGFTPFKNMAKTQAGAEMLAQAVCKVLEVSGDYFINSKVKKYISTTGAEAIARIHANGDGALIIIRMQEWEVADFNQNRAHNLLGIYLSSGSSYGAAMSRWLNPREPKLTEMPKIGWRFYDDYIWLPSHDDIILPHSSLSD